jgi:hypothetical protein
MYAINHNISNLYGSWFSALPIPDRPKHHFVAQPFQGKDQFLDMEKIVDDQWIRYGRGTKPSDLGGFLWEIAINPYDMGVFDNEIPSGILSMNRTLPPSLPEDFPRGRKEGCRYINKEPSAYVRNVVEKVWEDVHDPHSTIGFLHIRRGDAANECNTTIDQLRSYFECTFSNTTKYGNIKLLFATDETDNTYLRAVKSTLEDLYSHVQVLHLDPIVEKHIFHFFNHSGGGAGGDVVGSSPSVKRLLNNNYFTFQVTTEIRYERAAFSIQRRRKMCNHCDYLSTWSKVKWKKQQEEEKR